MDCDLLNAAMVGDQTAFAELMRRHAQYIRNRIARRVRYAVDVDDLLQETFVAAYLRLGQLRHAERLAGWLGAIADNQVRLWYRRRYVQLRLEAAVETEAGGDEADVDLGDLKRALRHAVGDLSPVQQEAIVYHYFKGYSYAEAASLLGIRQDTLRSRLQKARKRLKKEMDAVPEDAKNTMNSFSLDVEDLSALAWATCFTSDDPQRPVLQGICLDRGGRIVATDGHRLLLRQAAGLKGVTTPVLLGPVAALEIPAGTEAVLSLAEGIRLTLNGALEQRIPIQDGPYVAYEKVIPPLGPMRAYLNAGAWTEALDAMADQLEGRHPVRPEEGRRYTPLVDVRLSGAEQTVVLLTTDGMGYANEEGVETAPVPSAVSWTFSVAVEARIEPEDTVFRTRVNYRYLRQIVAALEVSEGEELMLSVSALDKVLMLMPAARQDAKALLMPCRMEVDAAYGLRGIA